MSRTSGALMLHGRATTEQDSYSSARERESDNMCCLLVDPPLSSPSRKMLKLSKFEHCVGWFVCGLYFHNLETPPTLDADDLLFTRVR